MTTNGHQPNKLQLSRRAKPSPKEEAASLKRELSLAYTKLANARLNHRRELRAKFDAAQTFIGNENHWQNADFLDPHVVAGYEVRRRLRSRSRYEICENNPYLKGTCLTIVNDFVGSGPKLQITDDRLTDQQKKLIQQKFMEWAYATHLRQKLWRMRMAKIVDGESFMLPYQNKNRLLFDPVLLDFQVIEADRVSSLATVPITPAGANYWEIDGVRFDKYENPISYHVLFRHPGSLISSFYPEAADGKWIDAKYIVHWFRQDRGWLRGIPEATPSLPLCAILRRYTTAVLRNSEVIADMTVLLETEMPPGMTPWTDGAGNQLIDDPFDLFPLEQGMAMNLPYGYKAKQLGAVPLGIQYDEYVGSLLREITRPILSPYNITSGSSKDSNMASGVLDATIYKGGQAAERLDCEEAVLCRIFYLWWQEAIRIPGHITGSFTSDRWKDQLPKHRWRWDRIGIDHTDPARVAEAMKVLHDKRFLTDADIQEQYYNRDVEVWRDEIEEDDKFRDSLAAPGVDSTPPPPEAPPGQSDSKPKSPPKNSRPAKKTSRK